jgi:hypothetical protein
MACGNDMAPVGVSHGGARSSSSAPSARSTAPDVPSPIPADYRSTMVRLFEAKPSEGHGAYRFDTEVFANKIALESTAGPYPDGAVFVAAHREGDAEGPTMMMKKEGGAWRFFSVHASRAVASEESLGACRMCHEEAARDLVFRRASPQAPKAAEPTK